MAEIIFWISISLILLITVGYPLVIILLGRIKEYNPRKYNDYQPFVTLIIAAHNEERVIEEKIRNTLALDYPKDKIEVIVASDGSTDHTNEITKKYGEAGIVLYEYDRLGKTGIQNETVKRAKGEIIVFSDANAMYEPDAISKMVRHFKYYNIG